MIFKDIDAEQTFYTIENQGFWYALTDGGYLEPQELLEEPVDIKAVENARDVILKFERELMGHLADKGWC